MDRSMIEKFIALAATCALSIAGALTIFAQSSLTLLGAGNSGQATVQFATLTEDSASFIGNRGMGYESRQLVSTGLTNPSGYPTRVAQYRLQWEEFETSDDSFTCTTLNNFIDSAAALGQSVGIRIYENDFGSGFGCPSWIRAHSGYQVDFETNTNYVCDWENSSARTEHLEMVAALKNCINSRLQYIVYIDTGWGMYNELNYSGTDIVAVTGAGTGGGTVGNEVPLLTQTAYEALYANWRTHFSDDILVGFTDRQADYDLTTDTYNWQRRGDGWGYRNTSGITCPDGTDAGTQMCTIYPATIADGSTDWQTKRKIAESYSSLTNWVSSGYAYASSFQWLEDNHFSIVDVRNYFSPNVTIQPHWEDTLLKVGYRQYLRRVEWPSTTLTAGNNYTFNLYFQNKGVAPDYMNHYPAIKLQDQAGKGYQLCVDNDKSNWYPYATSGEAVASISCTLSASLPAGTYDILAAIVNGTTNEADVNLAVTASPTNRWYDVGNVTISSGASTSLHNQADFEESSDQYLTITDNADLSLEGGDFTIALGFNGESFRTGAGGHVLVAKGDIGATGQEYSLAQIDSSGTKYLRGRISTGTNQSVTSTVALSTATDYCTTFRFNNTSKEMKLCVNGTCDTFTASGSMSAKANAFRIGGDTIVTDRTWDGKINNVIVAKRRWTDAEATAYCAGNKPLRLDQMTLDHKVKAVAYWSFDSSLTADSIGSNTLTNTNTVTSVSATEP